MRFAGMMIDMDGTIYKGGVPIHGAVDFIRYLRKRKIPFLFLTNNSSRPRHYYSEKVKRMGFDVSESNILTSNVAACRYIMDRYPGSKVYPLASPDVEDEMESYGMTFDDRDPDIVYLTFDKTITYEKLNNAYHFIMKGARLIASHPDDLCPTEDAYDVDIGPFIRLFESLTGKKAEIIGKPNGIMLEMAAVELRISAKDAVMIGDRLYTDIKMANDAGIASILVLTGEAKMEDLKDSGTKPTYVVASVADIPKMLDQ